MQIAKLPTKVYLHYQIKPSHTSNCKYQMASTTQSSAENGVVTSIAADEVEAPSTMAAEKKLADIKAKWPGWPGYSVFRIVVPVLKVGSIIGRKGDLIKKLVEETRARVRVLDGPTNSPDRIVLISGKEEPETALSPAMDAIIRIFKRVNGLVENDGDVKTAAAAFCSIRLLVASTQAITLIGKQGSVIKSIQEISGASVRVLSNDEMPIYASSEERIVELQGEGHKVLKALEAVVGQLRKFLVDQSILPLFEKSYNAPATQEREVETWSNNSLLHATSHASTGGGFPISMKRDLYLDHENHTELYNPSSRLSLYGPDRGLGSLASTMGHGPDRGLGRLASTMGHGPDRGLGSLASTMGHSGGPFVTQVAQTMQIPMAYAEDIIGVHGANIEYIRRTSGAILTVQEIGGKPDEITVEIKGTSSQVQVAQQLIQEFTSREPSRGSYGNVDSILRQSYSQLGSNNSYSSSFTTTAAQPYGGYGSSGGVGGYNSSFRL